MMRNIVKRGAGRQLQVLARVEPDRLARLAEIDLDLAAHVAVERLRLHGFGAARTVHA